MRVIKPLIRQGAAAEIEPPTGGPIHAYVDINKYGTMDWDQKITQWEDSVGSANLTPLAIAPIRHEGAIAFDGANKAMRGIPVSAGAGDHTYMMRVKLDAITDYLLGSSLASGAILKLVSGGFIYRSKSGEANHTFSVSNVPTSQWVLITLTREGSSIRLYVDGQISSTNVTESASFDVDQIGAGSTSGSINGSIDKFYIFDYALDQSEVDAYVISTALPYEQPPVPYEWKDINANGEFSSGNILSKWKASAGGFDLTLINASDTTVVDGKVVLGDSEINPLSVTITGRDNAFELSLMAKVNITSNDGSQAFISTQPSNSTGIVLGRKDSLLGVYISARWVVSSHILDLNIEQVLGCTVTSNVIRFYVSGVLVDTVLHTSAPLRGLWDLTLGSISWIVSEWPLEGTIDSARLYPQMLTDEQMSVATAEMNKANPIPAPLHKWDKIQDNAVMGAGNDIESWAPTVGTAHLVSGIGSEPQRQRDITKFGGAQVMKLTHTMGTVDNFAVVIDLTHTAFAGDSHETILTTENDGFYIARFGSSTSLKVGVYSDIGLDDELVSAGQPLNGEDCILGVIVTKNETLKVFLNGTLIHEGSVTTGTGFDLGTSILIGSKVITANDNDGRYGYKSISFYDKEITVAQMEALTTPPAPLMTHQWTNQGTTSSGQVVTTLNDNIGTLHASSPDVASSPQILGSDTFYDGNDSLNTGVSKIDNHDLFCDEFSRFSISARFTPDSATQTCYILGRSGSAADSRVLALVLEDSVLSVRARRSATTIGSLIAGIDTIVSLTWDGSSLLAFVNDSPPVVTSVGVGSIDTANLVLGDRSSADTPFTGSIHEINIHNGALSANQVEHLHDRMMKGNMTHQWIGKAKGENGVANMSFSSQNLISALPCQISNVTLDQSEVSQQPLLKGADIVCNGTSDHLVASGPIGTHNLFCGPSTKFSLSLRFRHKNETLQYLIVRGSNVSRVLTIYVAGVSVYFKIRGAGAVLAGTISINEWSNITITWDGSYATWYVNDGVGEVRSIGNEVDSLLTTSIGADPTGYLPFYGDIHEINVHDHALTANEVRENHERMALPVITDRWSKTVSFGTANKVAILHNDVGLQDLVQATQANQPTKVSKYIICDAGDLNNLQSVDPLYYSPVNDFSISSVINMTVSVVGVIGNWGEKGWGIQRAGSKFRFTKFSVVDIQFAEDWYKDREYKVTFTVSSTAGVSLYIDGVFKETIVDTSDIIQTGAAGIMLGGHGASAGFGGYYKDTIIHDGVLTAQEVADFHATL